MADEVQRSLGRIEGTQTQILQKLEALETSFGDHRNDDQKNFSEVRSLVYTKFNQQEELRETHLSAQDKNIAALKRDSDRAKGAGWVILGLLSALATFLGGVVIAALSGHINLK